MAWLGWSSRCTDKTLSDMPSKLASRLVSNDGSSPAPVPRRGRNADPSAAR
eukprot:CAMPEP_0118993242 /NCGR_PEP_ID=MMETSP1173-20130426/54715_1 /TAXON_ID=1034831 /ORGANISM="Rhizochromulina marina cf, Strain CCMP1243" /LENGTH=50 /DNA_ID=CAMNT_0006944473 /DNA_START=168 /DNA_END=320 /DNA_ORIENTATION=+